MLVFGIDVPLIEVLLAFGVIIFLLLVESIILIALLVKQMNKAKKLGDMVKELSETILQIKKLEIVELDKLKRK